MADPAGGVEARGEHEPDAVAGERAVSYPRDLEQCLQSRTGAAPDGIQADAGEDSVLINQRYDVGDGAEADEVEQVGKLFPRALQGREYAPGKLERDSDSGQFAKWICRIRPLRIHDGDSGRKSSFVLCPLSFVLGSCQFMVVRDDNVDARLCSGAERLIV